MQSHSPPKGKSTTIGTDMFVGFGGIQIAAQVNEATHTAKGTQFFIVTMVKK